MVQKLVYPLPFNLPHKAYFVMLAFEIQYLFYYERIEHIKYVEVIADSYGIRDLYSRTRTVIEVSLMSDTH